MATRKISKMLQHQINTLIFNQPTLLSISNDPPMSLNYTLISKPSLLNHNHMAFSFDGHLLDTRELAAQLPETYPLETLSYLCANQNSLKIILTEHAVNTALATLHKNRLL